MDEDHDRALRERGRSTWWVGRGTGRSNPWAPLLLCATAVGWGTAGWLLADREGPWWPLLVGWLLVLWFTWWTWSRLRAGKDPEDTWLDRWGEAHPRLAWTAVVAVVAGFVLLALLLD